MANFLAELATIQAEVGRMESPKRADWNASIETHSLCSMYQAIAGLGGTGGTTACGHTALAHY